jgi:gluconolactonase
MRRTGVVLAEGIGSPEGPCVLPDGRVVFTNTYKSEILSWDVKEGVRSYAYTGGAPNSCLLGSDGLVYIANCPTAGSWVARDGLLACIQRTTPEGGVEVMVTEADGVRLDGANDLCFGPDGRLYFTDSGDWAPQTKHTPAGFASSSRTARRISSKNWITPIPTGSLPRQTAASSGSSPIP